LSLLYSLTLNKDGSYSFTSGQGHNYLIYFAESILIDADKNTHTVYNFGFSRNGTHSSDPFKYRYDSKIRDTIISVINDFFLKSDHRTLIYFCYGDDGFSRHRNIVFKKWCDGADPSIENYNKIVPYLDNNIYASLLIKKDNPLKKLIIDAFDINMQEIADYNN
jgi:hypothetical protein